MPLHTVNHCLLLKENVLEDLITWNIKVQDITILHVVFQIYQERRGHVFIQNKEYENLTFLSFSNFLFFSLMNDCPPFAAVQSLGHAWLFVTPRGCSTLGFPVLHYLLEFVQTHAHWVDDAIQPSHSLSPPSPPALNLSQHQGLFQWVGFLTALLRKHF